MNILVLFSLLLLLFVTAISSTQTELCSHLQSPVTFKIPTFQALAPLGNNNGIIGQATWVFQPVGAFYTRSNITFNACSVDPLNVQLLSFIDSIKFVVNHNQTLDYSVILPIENKYAFGGCIGGSVSIDADVGSVSIRDQLVTLSLLDDRHTSYAVYFVNGVEGLVGFNSTVPPTPVLLPALNALS